MLKYSIVYNLPNFAPILIKFVSKFIVSKVLYFKAECLLRLRLPLIYVRIKQFFFSCALKTAGWGVTNVDPDQTLYSMVSGLDIRCYSQACLSKY